MCISRLLFFASALLLTVFYIYLRLEMMLAKGKFKRFNNLSSEWAVK